MNSEQKEAVTRYLNNSIGDINRVLNDSPHRIKLSSSMKSLLETANKALRQVIVEVLKDE